MSERKLFEAALDLPPADRPAFLDSACAGDAPLRQRLDALLRQHDLAGSFLEDPLVASEVATRETSPPSDPPGLVLAGRYELLERIGEGGMGTVWKAQQTEPVRRLVAVKLIRSGLDSRAVLTRFEAERQALALMDHPNIARVFDAGTTDSGRPFFVMELVHGVPITQYCDDNQLTPRQRLELFLPVCQAIQHAHHKGIIHRDIKPSNVLVALNDDQPVVKVIDFGLAKAIGPPLTDETVHTGFGAVVGTVEYMSPEQASLNAIDIDTRSDIYSLGVLLYELLTGTTPLEHNRVKQTSILEALRIIREEETPTLKQRLSTRDELPAIAARRGSEPARLTKLVSGELDWIVLKALEKDRSRRYETANGFALDVQRYLAGEPVLVAPRSLGYVLRKFVARNQRALVMATVVFTMLLVSVGAIAGSIGWVSRDRAARQAEREQEREGMLDLAERFRAEGNWGEARAAAWRVQGLLRAGGSREQWQRWRQLGKDLDMVAQLEEVSFAAAEEDMSERRLLDVDRAYAAAFRDYGIDLAVLDPPTAAQQVRASAIREPLLAALDDWDWQQEMLAFGKGMSNFVVSGLPVVKQAAQEQSAHRDKPAEATVPAGRARDVATLADGDTWRKRLRSVAILYGKVDRQAVTELARQSEVSSLSPASALLLSRALLKVGLRERSWEILSTAQQRHPADLRLNAELAWRVQGMTTPKRHEEAARFLCAALALRPDRAALHVRLGNRLLAAGNTDQAITACRRAIELKPDHARAHAQLGDALTRKRAWHDALSAYTRAIALDGSWPAVHAGRARVHTELGQWELASVDHLRAAHMQPYAPEAWCERAAVLLLAGKHDACRDLCRAVLGMGHGHRLGSLFTNKRTLARIAYLAARACVLPANAFEDPHQVVRLAERAITLESRNAWYLHVLALAHFRAGEFDRAIQRFHESMKAHPPWSGQVVNWLGLALASHRAGKEPEARQWFNKSVHWMEKVVDRNGSAAALPGLHIHDWLACHVLRREAEALFGDKSRGKPQAGPGST